MEKYWLWLASVKGIGTKNFKKLLSGFGNPEQVYFTSKAELLAITGVGKTLAESIITSRTLDQAERSLEKMKKANIKLLTITDPFYPEKVKKLPDAPALLYYRGSLRKDNMGVAIIGARRSTEYGKIVTMEAASFLAKYDIPVISGMAKGIDGYAHTATLKAGGYTIAFLGHGVDICYPKEHQGLMDAIIENGAVISQYPPGTPIRQAHFPMRNYLISAWSHKILVVEASAKSGSLITAEFAKEQNREVFAVPNGIYQKESQGTNLLIAAGAKIYLEPSQLLPEGISMSVTTLKTQSPPSKPIAKTTTLTQTDDVEQKILAVLTNSILSIDQLADFVAVSVTKVIIEVVAIMELEGKVKRLPGAKVTSSQ